MTFKVIHLHLRIFKCYVSYSCAAVDKISTKIVSAVAEIHVINQSINLYIRHRAMIERYMLSSRVSVRLSQVGSSTKTAKPGIGETMSYDSAWIRL